jgi:hypothetical protein
MENDPMTWGLYQLLFVIIACAIALFGAGFVTGYLVKKAN